MTAIIVDGISASGKSLLLRGLKRMSDESGPNYTKLYLTEHLTERFFERMTPPKAEIHAHVARVLRLAGEIESMRAASPFANNERIVTITIERLFLTLLSRGLMTDEFFSEHAELVGNLELTSILLVIPAAQIEDRIALSLTQRSQGWRDYIDSLGGLTGAVSHFAAQQDRMLQANNALSGRIATDVIEVSDVIQLSDDYLLKRLLWPHTSVFSNTDCIVQATSPGSMS